MGDSSEIDCFLETVLDTKWFFFSVYFSWWLCLLSSITCDKSLDVSIVGVLILEKTCFLPGVLPDRLSGVSFGSSGLKSILSGLIIICCYLGKGLLKVDFVWANTLYMLFVNVWFNSSSMSYCTIPLSDISTSSYSSIASAEEGVNWATVSWYLCIEEGNSSTDCNVLVVLAVGSAI